MVESPLFIEEFHGASTLAFQFEHLFAPNETDWQEAWAAFDQGKPGDAGIVDQVSFAIMRRLGIRQAFTNDRHFSAAGFETLFSRLQSSIAPTLGRVPSSRVLPA
jgi:hypothetical protein